MSLDMLHLLAMPTTSGLFKQCFVFFCKKCGSEFTGEYDVTAKTNRIISSKLLYINDWLRNESIRCPLCGAILDKSGGYFMGEVSNFFGSEDEFREIFGENPLPNECGNSPYVSSSKKIETLEEKRARLAIIREQKEKISLLRESEAIAATFDLQVDSINTSTSIQEIKSNPDELKTYILTLLNLENTIYSLTQRLGALLYQQMLNNRFAIQCAINDTGTLADNICTWNNQYSWYLKELKELEEKEPKPVVINFPQKPKKPALKEPGLFNKKKVLEENQRLTDQYNTAIEAYKEEVACCHQKQAQLKKEATVRHKQQLAETQSKIEDAQQRISQQQTMVTNLINQAEKVSGAATAINEMILTEISETKSLISKYYSVRNELYAYNIIFGKYRNSIALSSFYEYLVSGRCSTLEGADGAYNIFENDIRANRVIAQLDTVISSLEDIKDNQYMIYQEIRSTNTLLNNLNSTMNKALTSIQGIEANTTQMSEYMERIAENSDVIAHNSAITAYYSKVNADLTNAIGFMLAYK